jgi:hypothetical protein
VPITTTKVGTALFDTARNTIIRNKLVRPTYRGPSFVNVEQEMNQPTKITRDKEALLSSMSTAFSPISGEETLAKFLAFSRYGFVSALLLNITRLVQSPD